MKKAVFFFAWWLGCFSLLGQNIVYVNPEAQGVSNGTSWKDAYTDLKQAIANAAPGAELWLARPFNGFQVSERNNLEDHIVIDKPLALRGGFLGNEKNLQERDLYNKGYTTLEGDIGQKYDWSDNSRNAFIIRASVVLDRIHFKNFNSGYDKLDYYGAVYVDTNVAVTIQECIFTGNDGRSQGICVSAAKDAAVTIRGARFESNNQNGYGALIGRNENSVIDIADSDFLNNGQGNGGSYIFYSLRAWDNKAGTEENKKTLLSVSSCNFAGNSMDISYSYFGGSRFVSCQFILGKVQGYTFNHFGDSASVYVDSCRFMGSYQTYLFYASGLKEFVFNNTVIENPAGSEASLFYVQAGSVTIDGSEFNNIRGSACFQFQADNGRLTLKNSRFKGGKASSYYLYAVARSMHTLNTGFIDVEASLGNYFTLDSLYIKNSTFTGIRANGWLDLAYIKNVLIDSSRFSDIVQFETLFRISMEFVMKNSIVENIRMANVNPGRPLLFHNWSNTATIENTWFANVASAGPIISNVGGLRWLGSEIDGIDSPKGFLDNAGDVLIYNSNFHGLRGPWIISQDDYYKSAGKSVTLLNNIIFSDNDTMVCNKVTEAGYHEYIANCVTNRPLPSGSSNVIETVLDYYELYEPYGIHLLQDKGMPLADTLYVPEKDLAGNPRIVSGKIDIGAYERDVLVTAARVSDDRANDWCFPNPFSDMLTLQLTEESEVEILSLRGELLHGGRYTAGSPVIRTGWLDPGVYILGIRTAKGMEQMRIVKN